MSIVLFSPTQLYMCVNVICVDESWNKISQIKSHHIVSVLIGFVQIV